MTAAFLCSVLLLLALNGLAATPAQSASTPPQFSSSLLSSGQAASWDQLRWDRELAAIQRLGIGSIVLTASLSDASVDQADSGLTAKTAYYPTTLSGYHIATANGAPVDVVGSALRAAQKAGMTVWLGLQTDNPTWFSSGQLDASWLATQAELAGRLAEDLWAQYGAAYHDTIAGWYQPYENNNYDAVVSTGLNRPLIMHSFFLQLGEAIDAVSTAAQRSPLPIMISPFYFSALPNSADYQEFWRISLSGTSIDVVALQVYADMTTSYQETDSFRAALISEWTAAVSRGVAAANNGAQTWANIELFQSNPAIGAATVKYAVEAMKAAAPYVTAFTNFSFSHHWSPWTIGYDWFSVGYLDYLSGGAVPVASVPSPGSPSMTLSSQNTAKISWRIPASTQYHIVYFEIFSMGNNRQRISTASWDSNNITIPADFGTKLAIRSVDAAGNVSSLSSIRLLNR
ncbi:hypothetical protein UM93_01235 [Psychromicrobium lacuslunae]|uniref:DUF4434 domain-containing protein n=2 Tax=Psychromicrobium lacuslunae TaxID=1618207 RepID=A0A0D4BWL9_9MICC|nr:hypothetical protein UM93_01235 [Psychromicrobium lacuslunae]